MGGAERSLVELALGLDRRLFEPVVYCLGPRPAGNPSSLADKLERAGVPVRFFGAQRIGQALRILRAVRRQLAADCPQIVQSFLFHANVLATLAAHRAGVPHVVTGIRVAERRYAWYRFAEAWTSRWAERHVCVSGSVRRFCEERVGLRPEKLVIIPNGVDAERFAAAKPLPLAEMGIDSGRRVIGLVGRLDRQKGIDWLLPQLPGVFRACPQHDLIVVGEGRQRLALEQLSAALGLAGRVHFVGFRPDVPEVLAACDALVLPSRWEGMPNVVLEAMASGKPVVANNVEGVAELLGDNADGQLAAAGDGEGFSERLISLLQNPAVSSRLGAENQLRARENYGILPMIRAYERLYLSLVGDERRG